VRAVMDQRAAEASYGISEAELTPTLNWSAYSQRKSWNRAKDAVAPWWAENSDGDRQARTAAALHHRRPGRGRVAGRSHPEAQAPGIGVIVAFVLGLELIILGALR